ncbi:nudix hydrolase 2-like [Tripterygium wilfordii]|uniref:Nudix hydrolase 2-like n=1 Tax=Tripterygium wilfordii TaxID=458696 RepID=A0A7J7D4T1_TRIWF|nr:nudix hydrolase 2-like [Tripterygium wilfordii]KAF5741365.1 nudix hydrolase 2-like [Tripterygium wilfordii]
MRRLRTFTFTRSETQARAVSYSSSISNRPCVAASSFPCSGVSPRGIRHRIPLLIRKFSFSTSSLSLKNPMEPENRVQRSGLLSAVDDLYGGVMVDMKEHMDVMVFVPLLRASLSYWRELGKKGIWIKVPIQLVHLIEPAVKEGFRFHHAEPEYLMLVCWISETTDTLPSNASHRVGIGAFVMNTKQEVLVVQEKGGKFKGTGVWKFPTGVVNEGEDICESAVREVKEETGVDTEFVEVLAFRQSHQSFFGKSDLFFVCMLQPRSSHIQKQMSELEAAQWMPFEEYAAQPFVRDHKLFNYIANICLAKSEKGYSGFPAVSTTTSSGKTTNLYVNKKDLNEL